MTTKKYQPVRHTLTLEFTTGEKRIIEAAARRAGVISQKFIFNTVLGSAESIVDSERRANRFGFRG